MASHIPTKLKAADLSRFIIRATQLETAKPVIAYWCEYWIVNQILSKGLHNGDAETLQYTTTLMDKLEQIKAENATNDAIVDDAAGQAYVEQFALETFQRADRAVQANKVTRQTADTFLAASTFFELINIWATPDPETQAKIKYAKWNAVRIGKALKEGKDPNESNPKPQPVEEEGLPELDPNDPEVQQLGGPVQPQPAFVEDAPDEQDHIERKIARLSSVDRSLHPSAQVSARGSPGTGAGYEPYPRDGFPYTVVQDDNVSPLEQSPKDRNGSLGGGYFPEVPTFTSDKPDPIMPTISAPEDTFNLGLPDTAALRAPSPKASPDFESFPPPTISNDPLPPPPQDFYQTAAPNYTPGMQPPPQPPLVPQSFHYPPPPQQSQAYPPTPPQPQQPQPPFRAPPPQKPTYHPPPQQPPPHFQPPPPTQPQYQAPPPAKTNQQLNTDDVAIAKAQKHARWAISALNFEDAETAVRELRAALQTLGAN